jgi:hypothetical protein
VFLWTELVVKAICSEIRKGRKLDQLDLIISDFPTDLDGYFQNLIFNRIGTSQRNITDTAAALRLAMEIETSEKTSPDRDENTSPEPRSFMNFWLLSQGHLATGFSWKDYSRLTQPCIERMLSQTASFLHETCKDLLTLREGRWSYEFPRVGFLHRTVFDFLSDNTMDPILERRAPKHFSDREFIFNLSRLRCVCLLRMDYGDDRMMTVLCGIISSYQHLIHLEANVSWLLTCESLVVAHVQLRTPFCTNMSWVDDLEALCVKAGMRQVLSELYKVRPFGVLRAPKSAFDLPILGELLIAMDIVETRPLDMNLLRQALEYGCDPNSHVGNWPGWRSQRGFLRDQRRSFEIALSEDLEVPWCRRTIWQAWLGEAYIRFIESANSHPGLGNANEVDELFELRKRDIGAMAILLLQYGADPHCMICLTNHDGDLEPYDGKNCIRRPLLEILERITSACTVAYLQDLVLHCSHKMAAYFLRRNQLRRALRSFSLSVRLEEWEYMGFLGYLTGGTHNKCSRCSTDSLKVRLTTWCIDCQQQSDICHRCLQLDIPGTTAYERSCQASAGIGGISGNNHTVVTFVYQRDRAFHHDDLLVAEQNFSDRLVSRYDPANAISSLIAWYAKDPIEPNLSFEEAIRSRTSPPSIDGMQESSGEQGSMSTQQRMTSNRPWLL